MNICYANSNLKLRAKAKLMAQQMHRLYYTVLK
jgi:hypothetical protein